MAEQLRPASKPKAPDPSDCYERSHPENEAGMGRLDTNRNATPTTGPETGLFNPIDSESRQLNSHDVVDQRAAHRPQDSTPPQPDHSILEEEPDGWDQAPQDISNPQFNRHPRTGGKGGTP